MGECNSSFCDEPCPTMCMCVDDGCNCSPRIMIIPGIVVSVSFLIFVIPLVLCSRKKEFPGGPVKQRGRGLRACIGFMLAMVVIAVVAIIAGVSRLREAKRRVGDEGSACLEFVGPVIGIIVASAITFCCLGTYFCSLFCCIPEPARNAANSGPPTQSRAALEMHPPAGLMFSQSHATPPQTAPPIYADFMLQEQTSNAVHFYTTDM